MTARTSFRGAAPAALLVAALGTTSACSTAPAPSPDEAALMQALGEKVLVPGSAEARAAAEDADPISRAAFWAREYETNPVDREAALGYARALRGIGQPARAAAVANQALAMRPNDADLLMVLGAALLEDGRGAGAVAPLSQAVALEPTNALAHTRLGVALDNEGRHAEAQARYRIALELTGNADVLALTNLGVSLILDGDPAAGEVPLRTAASLPGADEQVRQNLALALALQGRFDEAESVAQTDLPASLAAQNVDAIRRTLTGPSRWERLSAQYGVAAPQAMVTPPSDLPEPKVWVDTSPAGGVNPPRAMAAPQQTPQELSPSDNGAPASGIVITDPQARLAASPTAVEGPQARAGLMALAPAPVTATQREELPALEPTQDDPVLTRMRR